MKDMIFYQAPDARTGDVIPKYIDGAWGSRFFYPVEKMIKMGPTVDGRKKMFYDEKKTWML